MVKNKSKILMLILLSLLCTTILGIKQVKTHASPHRVYDLSEWQGRLNANTVKRLKQEVPFVILRAQYGTGHTDYTFKHNQALLRKYKLPYGVYSFSLYHDHASAVREAQNLYRHAPRANFYVNDFETTSLSSSSANRATKTWVKTLRKLVGKRKILFYSYQDFMYRYAANAVSLYNGYWLASYTNQEPRTEHVMWQYTDHFYSPALQKRVDASKFKRNKHWFIGKKKRKKAQLVTPVSNKNNPTTQTSANQSVVNPQSADSHQASTKQPTANSNSSTVKVINTSSHVKNHIRKHHGKKVVKKHHAKRRHKKVTKRHVKRHVKKHVKKHGKKRHIKCQQA